MVKEGGDDHLGCIERPETNQMKRMNLREAADRTLRSVTTLRRYLRSGRLKAEKIDGRYGPEYFVTERELSEAGLLFEQEKPSTEETALTAAHTELAPSTLPYSRETVPLTLFQELQMKHEQLLVQYGMVRATGMRVMELQNEVLARTEEAEVLRAQIALSKAKLVDASAPYRVQARKAELELKGRQLEIDALKEKVRALEMLTRNAVTTETIERQFTDLLAQEEKVERHAPEKGDPRRAGYTFRRPTPPEPAGH